MVLFYPFGALYGLFGAEVGDVLVELGEEGLFLLGGWLLLGGWDLG